MTSGYTIARPKTTDLKLPGMSENATDIDLHMTECPRDSGVETNLRCARCDDPICPRCMVYAPVGSKCPDCASIGGPQIFKVTQSDLMRIGFLGGAAAIGIGIAVAAVLGLVGSLEVLAEIPRTIWLIVVGIAQFGGAMAVSQVMRVVGGLKYSTKLRVMAGVLALLFYVSEVFFFSEILGFDVRVAGLVDVAGLIGFAFGTYYAMQRFKTS